MPFFFAVKRNRFAKRQRHTKRLVVPFAPAKTAIDERAINILAYLRAVVYETASKSLACVFAHFCIDDLSATQPSFDLTFYPLAHCFNR